MADVGQEHKLARLSERMTTMMELLGFPHSAARIYTALMLADGEGLATGELVEGLDMSKASVSTSTQLLLAFGLIERYRVSGSREAHYRIVKGVWGPILAKKFEAISVVTATAREALDMAQSEKAVDRLQEMYDVYSFFEQEFQAVLQHWRERGL